MNKTPSKVVLAAKLLKTNNFVLITDEEAFTRIELPNNGDDQVTLAWRLNVLKKIHGGVGKAVKVTEDYIDKLLAPPKGGSRKKPAAKKKPQSKPKKIEVKQG